MSRLYNMYVEISEFDPQRKDAIIAAAEEEWQGLRDWFDNRGTLSAYGEDVLCGGESEEEFAERFAKAIWKANGGYCAIEVRATYLEDLPYNSYEFDEEDYKDLVGGPIDGADA